MLRVFIHRRVDITTVYPARYKTAGAIAAAIVVRWGRKDREKKSKRKKPEASSRAQIPRPLLHLLSLFADRSLGRSWLGPWAEGREVHRREANEEDEGPERGTDRSVRERNPRLPWLPSHSRLASLPWRRRVNLSLSPSAALCLFPSPSQSPPSLFPRTRCRVTFSFSHTRRTSPIPSRSRSLSPGALPVAPTRQASLYLWHSLIFPPFLRRERRGREGPER